MSIPYARNETFTSSANIIRAVNCTFTGENSHITVQKANNCIFDHCASVDVKKVYGRDSIIKSTVGEKETTITVDRPTTWVGEGKIRMKNCSGTIVINRRHRSFQTAPTTNSSQQSDNMNVHNDENGTTFIADTGVSIRGRNVYMGENKFIF